MSRLVEYGEVLIDFYEQSDGMGTGDAPFSNFNMPGGGSIDNFGSQDTFPGALNRGKTALIAKSTNEILQTTVNQLKALRGKREKLWRVDNDGEMQYVFARLISVGVTRTTDETRQNVFSIQSVSLVFMCDTDTWLGEFEGLWTLNDDYRINDELKINGGETITLTTTPQVEVVEITQDTLVSKKITRGPKITITAPVGSSFSSIVIANDEGATLTFAATVDAGDVLVIDAGSNTVTNDGVDAYDDLTVAYNSDYPYSWFPLIVGENTITITHNGADTIRFDYTEEHV